MNVLYLRTSAGLDRAYPDFVKAIGGRYPIEVYDPDQPVAEQFKGIDVVIDPGGAVGTRTLIDAALAEDVKLWQVTTNGTDHVDVAYFMENGLPLANSPGPLSAVPLAEHVLMLILCFAKNLNHNRVQGWQRTLNEELAGKVLGLIGFGASARELARRAWPLGMRIMAIDVVDVPQVELDEFHVEFIGKPSQIDHVLREADYLSLHVHLNPSTQHMVDRRALSLMKPTAVLLNVARGEIVDEAALIEALQTGRIKGAGLDVFAQEPMNPGHPLMQLDNVILTPHTSGYTPDTPRRRMEAAAENVDRIARGMPPIHLVTSLVC
ncbi:NAD(P)-dependent oxidoreductase [Candidatus Entotheonella palauensis]|uniref:NAD(P)-dependent oxidoreductase n=1 Tax=Candidatus Entotheonella palauensis TaxID=93172 RepID=UPI000B7C9D3A|nr:NAD(P)-dependent oxidoreductase [Candidatus Entotheonella palauensis]